MAVNILNKWAILIIAAIMVLVSSNINSGKDYSSGMIMSDGKGYYAYLPAIFIYHDLHFSFFEKIERETYASEFHFYEYRYAIDGKVINKYYSGTALAMLPFFGIGHLLSALTGKSLDGYSVHYTTMINLAAIAYLALGLWFLAKLLKTYQIRKGYITLILTAITFGTNVFYYTVVEFSMSHIYSFAFVTMFLYYTRTCFHGYDRKHLILAGAAAGMVLLIRPVNGLVIAAVPFLAGSWQDLHRGLKRMSKDWPSVLLAVFFAIAIFSIQMIIYKLQTGYFWVYSYGEERFHFSNPHMLSIVFSYKKGLFLYTPLLFISLAGFYFLWKQSRFRAVILAVFFLLLTYVLSSWWMWYYGGSFSSRVYIEFFALFAILLGIALEGFTRRISRNMYITLIVLLTVVCQIQTYQYRYYFIHWSEMNKEKYWDVFMRIDLLFKK